MSKLVYLPPDINRYKSDEYANGFIVFLNVSDSILSTQNFTLSLKAKYFPNLAFRFQV